MPMAISVLLDRCTAYTHPTRTLHAPCTHPTRTVDALHIVFDARIPEASLSNWNLAP